MADWYVGQKAVCVSVPPCKWKMSSWRLRWESFCQRIKDPYKGQVLTITSIRLGQRYPIGLSFFECGEGWNYNSKWFRPLVNQNTDISELQAILDRLPARENVSAQSASSAALAGGEDALLGRFLPDLAASVRSDAAVFGDC